MRFVDAETVDRVLDETGLADRIAAMFRDGCEQPVRHHHTVAVPGEPDATLLLMPAWQPGTALGVKLASVFPGAGSRRLPAVQASYLLLDPRTGAPMVLIDGARLTVRRTAAASGLAARYLARPDARTLLMVGAGALAPWLIRAHRAARPSLTRLLVWNHRPGKATALAETLGGTAVSDLRGALGQADVISCATLSQVPLVTGADLRPGTHVDLVGAFTPRMRESDDMTVRRATVFVDTRAGALKEGGDLVQAVAAGALSPGAVAAELAELVRGEHPGRRSHGEITLFKSVGAALEDLAAALLVAERTAP